MSLFFHALFRDKLYGSLISFPRPWQTSQVTWRRIIPRGIGLSTLMTPAPWQRPQVTGLVWDPLQVRQLASRLYLLLFCSKIASSKRSNSHDTGGHPWRGHLDYAAPLSEKLEKISSKPPKPLPRSVAKATSTQNTVGTRSFHIGHELRFVNHSKSRRASWTSLLSITQVHLLISGWYFQLAINLFDLVCRSVFDTLVIRIQYCS